MEKEGTNLVSFRESDHSYWYGEKRLTGVTTVLRVISKDLLPWAANSAVDHIKKHFRYDLPQDKLDLLLDEARTAYARKRDDAADIGKEFHKIVEEFVKHKMQHGVFPEKRVEDKQLQKMLDNFVGWATENKVEFLASEKLVYDLELFVAGTLDLICVINGKNYLTDTKSSSGIFPEMFLQTRGYQYLLSKTNPEIKIDGNLIVNCRKDGTFETQFSVDDEGNLKAFLGAYCIYKALNNQKNANKNSKTNKRRGS